MHATLVSQVISGSKNFTEEQTLSVCEFLGIPKIESQYLLTLVQIERAGTVQLKNHYVEFKKQIQKKSLQVSQRVKKNRDLTESEKAVFYSSWIYSAIQVSTTLLNETVDFTFICDRFNLDQAKARKIINFLIDTQLIREKEGLYTAGATSTHLDNESAFIVRHHANWRIKAIQSSENLNDTELMYSANFSVSKKDFNRLREEMIQTIQRFLSIVKDSPAEDIAQFNLDFFWIKK